MREKATETRRCMAGDPMHESPSREGVCEIPMHEAVEVKSPLQWRPQDIGDARVTGCLSRKAAYREWKQPMREMYVASSKVREADATKPFGTKVLDIRHEIMGFEVSLLDCSLP